MQLAKIKIKKDYNEKGDFVFRPLIRGYEKIGANSLLDDDGAVLIGYIKDDMFYELFTNSRIMLDNYEPMNWDEFVQRTGGLDPVNTKKIKSIIEICLFNAYMDLDFDISNSKELSDDRYVEFDAYNKGLSSINPYNEPLNVYNDFNEKIKIMKYNKR